MAKKNKERPEDDPPSRFALRRGERAGAVDGECFENDVLAVMMGDGFPLSAYADASARQVAGMTPVRVEGEAIKQKLSSRTSPPRHPRAQRGIAALRTGDPEVEDDCAYGGRV